MSDFSQIGVVPTLHDLGNRKAADLEMELRSWAKERPIGLVIPGLASDVHSPAFDGILAELKDADWLDHIIIGLDEADLDQYQRCRCLLEDLPQSHSLLWTDGPEIAAVEAMLRGVAAAPAQRGKGRNAWYCLGMSLALPHLQVIAVHDADILSYRRSMLTRLVYPVAHPNFGYRFAKGYYHRISDGVFGGRVTRLLVAPLLRALRDLTVDHRYLRYLESFRYLLSGELAMTAELAAEVRIPAHWGMDIGLLCDVYTICEPSSICQVAVADSYDHKHQALSANDPMSGLRRMSIDVTATILRHLHDDSTIADPHRNRLGGGVESENLGRGEGVELEDLGVDVDLDRLGGGEGVELEDLGLGGGVEGVELDRLDLGIESDRLGLGGGVESEDLGIESGRLAEAYLAVAKCLVRQYANDAEFNGYHVDTAAEQATTEVLALSVAEAVEQCHLDPVENAVPPSWRQTFERVPEVKEMLFEAARCD